MLRKVHARQAGGGDGGPNSAGRVDTLVNLLGGDRKTAICSLRKAIIVPVVSSRVSSLCADKFTFGFVGISASLGLPAAGGPTLRVSMCTAGRGSRDSGSAATGPVLAGDGARGGNLGPEDVESVLVGDQALGSDDGRTENKSMSTILSVPTLFVCVLVKDVTLVLLVLGRANGVLGVLHIGKVVLSLLR